MRYFVLYFRYHIHTFSNQKIILNKIPEYKIIYIIRFKFCLLYIKKRNKQLFMRKHVHEHKIARCTMGAKDSHF